MSQITESTDNSVVPTEAELIAELTSTTEPTQSDTTEEASTSNTEANKPTQYFFESQAAPNQLVMPTVWLTKPDPNGNLSDVGFRLSVVPTNLKGFHHFVQSNKTLGSEAVGTTDSIKEWQDTINHAMAEVVPKEVAPQVGALDGAVSRPGAEWTTTVQSGTDKAFAAHVSLDAGNVAPGVKLITGAAAVRRVTNLIGNLGRSINCPLYGTGIWLTIKAPTLASWIELDNKIALEKTELARQTRGISLSNQTVFFNSHILDFVLDHVIDCTLEDWSVEKIRNTMRLPDFQPLITYMAATVYTGGFPMSIACTVDISHCTHVTKELVNLSKIVWTDSNLLTTQQKKYMAERTKRRTQREVDEYQAQFENKFDSSVYAVADDGLTSTKIEFHIPSMDTHLNQGFAWIDSLVTAADESFGEELSGNRRDSYIRRQAAASEVRAWTHWIKRITVESHTSNGELVVEHVEDPNDINEIAVRFSSDNDISDNIEKAALKYINDTMVTIVAVPNFACPNCGKHHLTADGPNKHLLPIDAVSYFFIVLRRRILESRVR